MINSEYLAIMAIFLTGLYVGIKIKGASYKVKEYVSTQGKGAKIKFF